MFVGCTTHQSEKETRQSSFGLVETGVRTTGYTALNIATDLEIEMSGQHCDPVQLNCSFSG